MTKYRHRSLFGHGSGSSIAFAAPSEAKAFLPPGAVLPEPLVQGGDSIRHMDLLNTNETTYRQRANKTQPGRLRPVPAPFSEKRSLQRSKIY